jgi:hypothetical protein
MLQRMIFTLLGVFFLFEAHFGGVAQAASGTPPAPLAAHAAAADSAELINESGRLRMLAERIGKAYAQLALNVMPEKAQQQMAQSEQRFGANLALLAKGAATPQLRAQIDAIASLYQQYLKALAQPADKASVAAAHRVTEQLVAAAEKLTTEFEMQTKTSSARIINLAGRQRMLSQRMARLYFAAVLNGSAPDTAKYQLEFRQALAALEAAPLSSNEIKGELALAKSQWLFFEQALSASGNAPGNVRNAATTNERLLEVMDNLTALYGKALHAVVGLEPHAGAAS